MLTGLLLSFGLSFPLLSQEQVSVADSLRPRITHRLGVDLRTG